jgi:hypothetical protein
MLLLLLEVDLELAAGAAAPQQQEKLTTAAAGTAAAAAEAAAPATLLLVCLHPCISSSSLPKLAEEPLQCWLMVG